MKRVQAPKRKEKNPVDVQDFLRRVKRAKASKDEFQLGIYRSLYPKFPRDLQAALKREGITL